MNDDLQHLDLLSVFHYVVAGFAGLFALFPVFHLAMGIAMVVGGFGEDEPEATLVGWFFVLFAGAFMVAGGTLAALIFYAGRFLKQHTHYTYCLVVAGISCMLMPFGTVLGVFTIIVLMRPSVRELFGEGQQTAVKENDG